MLFKKVPENAHALKVGFLHRVDYGGAKEIEALNTRLMVGHNFYFSLTGPPPDNARSFLCKARIYNMDHLPVCEYEVISNHPEVPLDHGLLHVIWRTGLYSTALIL